MEFLLFILFLYKINTLIPKLTIDINNTAKHRHRTKTRNYPHSPHVNTRPCAGAASNRLTTTCVMCSRPSPHYDRSSRLHRAPKY